MIIDTLQDHLKAPIENMGYIFWGIEVENRPKGKGPLVRIYVDHEEGISVEDCQKVSHQSSGILDVEDCIASEYTLEVSSPGADRRVFNALQAKMLEGLFFKVKLLSAVDNRRNIKGTLHSVEDENLTFTIDDETISVDFNNIDRMRVIPKW